MKVLLALLLLAGTVAGQTLPPSPQGLTAQFSSTCAAATCATWIVGAATSVTVSVTGDGSWTGTFKASSDGGNTYFDATMIRLSDRTNTTTVSDTGDGQYAIVNSGITHLQFRLTTWVSGGANVWAIRGYGSPMAIPFSSGGGPILLSDGTAAAPAYAFASDTNTGIYRIGADNVGFSAGGTLRWDYNTARILSTIPFYAAAGTAAAPPYSFGAESTLGIFRSGTRAVDFVSSGASATWSWYDSADGYSPQTMRVFYKHGAASEWLETGNTGNNFYISTQTSGGTVRPLLLSGGTTLRLQISDVTQWNVSGSALYPEANNSEDLGIAGTNTLKTGHFGTSIVAPLFRSETAKVLIQGTGTGATQLAATQTTVPTCSSNCGTDPVVVGTDTAGIVTMGTSGSPASGWVVTFNGTWAAAPSCTVQMALAGMVVGKLPLTVVTTTTTITVVTNGTAPATSDKYAYTCVGVQ